MVNVGSNIESIEYKRQSRIYGGGSGGFTLIEVMAALMILTIVCSGVWVVIDRCMATSADLALRMAAFEVVRENMEKILTSGSVKEKVEYGTCDKYPDISWEALVETFSEPVAGKMWARAVCSAEYVDISGQIQTVRLEHWLTDLTEEQVAQITKNKEMEDAEFADQILETVEQAAEYAGVDVNTIEYWVENGLVKAEDGSFIKHNLDLFTLNEGKPGAVDKAEQVKSIAELSKQAKQLGKPADQQVAPGDKTPSDDIDPATGLKYEELEKMSVQQIIELINTRSRK
jgi:prepilin-type N-terminal cleavage/methylation domain-containing protein